MSNSNDGVSWRRDHQNPSEFTGYERRKEWNYNEIWQTNANSSNGPPGTYNYGQDLKDLYSESQPQYPENSGSYSRYDDQANSTVKSSYNRRSPDSYRRSPDAYRRHDRSRSNSRYDSRNRRSRRSSRERHRSSRHRRTHSRSKSRSKSRSTDRRKDSDKQRHKRRHSRSKSRDRRRRSASNTRSTSSRNNKSNSRRSKKRISSSDSDNETSQTQNIEILVPKVTIESAFKNDGSFLEMFKKMQDEENAKKEEAEKEIEKAPIPIIGKRRGGRVLKTGIVEKLKLAEDDENDGKPKDAWTIYMQEVKKYREASCQDEGKTRPLVK